MCALNFACDGDLMSIGSIYLSRNDEKVSSYMLNLESKVYMFCQYNDSIRKCKNVMYYNIYTYAYVSMIRIVKRLTCSCDIQATSHQ